jgi:hypothetical protein
MSDYVNISLFWYNYLNKNTSINNKDVFGFYSITRAITARKCPIIDIHWAQRKYNSTTAKCAVSS